MTLPGILSDRVFVIDTSSIIEVRRLFSQSSPPQRALVYDRLSAMVRNGTLFFPKKVLDELERGHEALEGTEDAPLSWAQEHQSVAVPDSELFEPLRAVLNVVRTLVDHDSTAPVEDADPYVVALAQKLRADGFQVTVIAQDSLDKPDKNSIHSACGLLSIPTVAIRAFLNQLGIRPR